MVQSRGRQYAPVVRALYILARRAMAKGEVTATEVEDKVANLVAGYLEDRPLPVATTMWKWEREEPDLPERLLRAGLLRPEVLPTWLRCHLRKADARLRSQGTSDDRCPQHTPEPVPLGSHISPVLSPSLVEALGRTTSVLASALAGVLALFAMACAVKVATAPSKMCAGSPYTWGPQQG